MHWPGGATQEPGVQLQGGVGEAAEAETGWGDTTDSSPSSSSTT